jgi:hypothetical protein
VSARATSRKPKSRHIATGIRHRALVPLLPAGRRIPGGGRNSVAEMIKFIDGSGLGAIGTPNASVAQIGVGLLFPLPAVYSSCSNVAAPGDCRGVEDCTVRHLRR